MAHFSKVDNGTVVDLIVVDNNDCGGGDFPDSEPIGQAFIAGLAAGDPRLEGTWLQTSYNTRDGLHYPGGVIEYTYDDEGNITGDNGTPEGAFRGNFGQIGFTYDPDVDEFLAPEDDA
jgi:YD repeat-containing protein